ncbi:uncharacterized protein F4807DRAFT_471741 [Annulohypoxylon truncatum]|uniref:uncharacterized protein n=1 Tax=Annulohypoxylon truncatum TaxID=327061 RepID=UPI002007CD42|nr:uncharacterized protein F4807DRAFT_471741 [Annulohypoxylon truncatum]KAI1204779.1 hypothetical protein F4807DRAFT_471741 [Annulohypoxylon truncatum]
MAHPATAMVNLPTGALIPAVPLPLPVNPNPALMNPPMPQLGPNGPHFLPTRPYQIPNPYHDSATCDDVVVCVVCGGICRPTTRTSINVSRPRLTPHWTHPVLIKAKPGFIEWCKQPCTARAYRRNDIQLFDIINVEQYVGGAAGFYSRMNGRMEINTQHDEMYLPIHMPCLELALKFCRYQSRFDINFRQVTHIRDSGEPSSIAHLYEIWMKRAWMTELPRGGRLTRPIMEPHKYLGAIVCEDLMEYSGARHNLEFSSTIQLQETDPSVDPLSTARAVMRAAVTIDLSDMYSERLLEFIELRARLATSPVEVRWLVEEAMEPFDNLGLFEMNCTRVYEPEWWMNKLINGDLIPWLHDLTLGNIQVVLDEPEGAHLKVDHVDWELLCRQLARPNPFDLKTGILRCPRLQNRHRIWRLLTGARLGHTVYKST